MQRVFWMQVMLHFVSFFALHAVWKGESWSPLSVFLSAGLFCPPPQCRMIHRQCRLTEQYDSSDHRGAKFIRAAGDLGTRLCCELLSIRKMSAANLWSLRWEIKRKTGGRKKVREERWDELWLFTSYLLVTLKSDSQRWTQELFYLRDAAFMTYIIQSSLV